jgi:hypothetical protein
MGLADDEELTEAGARSKDEIAGRKKRGRSKDQRSRTTLERKRDQRLIARWKLREKMDNEQISERLTEMYAKLWQPGELIVKVSRQSVDNEIKALEERLAKDAGRDILTLRAIKIGELTEYAKQAWADYEHSKRPLVKRSSEKGETTGEHGRESHTVRKAVEHRVGDARLLRIALDADKEVAELQNLYPPKKVAPTTPDGTEPYKGFELPEELKRFAAMLAEGEKHK